MLNDDSEEIRACILSEIVAVSKCSDVVYTKDIAEKFNVSRRVVSDLIKDNNINIKIGRRRGLKKAEKAAVALGYVGLKNYFIAKENAFKPFNQMAADLKVTYQTVAKLYHQLIR